jgi:hypothetical protein
MTIRSASSAALLLTATAIGALALAPEGHAGAADSTIPAPSVPGTISVPEGHHVSSRYDAAGFQVYKCSAAGTWTLHAPRAALWNRDTLDLGKHFGGVDAGLPAGPYWESRGDGSRVHGGSAISAPAPQPGSIPWLRLTALDTAGSGVFSEVTYIHRVDTSGGVAPAGTCDPDRSKLRPVPYAATYFFYERD